LTRVLKIQGFTGPAKYARNSEQQIENIIRVPSREKAKKGKKKTERDRYALLARKEAN